MTSFSCHNEQGEVRLFRVTISPKSPSSFNSNGILFVWVSVEPLK